MTEPSLSPNDPSALGVIAEAFTHAKRVRLPKVAQLYNAMVDVIATGRLEGGAKLPGERELSSTLGISLGTAQKSLSLLSRDGQIVREHGRGSFVQTGRLPLHELWHYRFRDPQTKALLPVYARLVNRSLVHDHGPWVDELGADYAGYVEITRLIDVSVHFSCWSTIRLGASRFGRLLDMPQSLIENVNLKLLFLQEFDAPTIRVRQTVRIGQVSKQVAGLIGVSDGSACLELRITALSRWGAPISHQTIVVPSTDYAMELGTEPITPDSSHTSEATRGR